MFRLKTLFLTLGLGSFVAAGPLFVSPVFAAPQAGAVQSQNAKKAGKTVKKAQVRKTAKKTRTVRKGKARRTAKRVRRERPSLATLAGLRKTDDPLSLGSSVALAVDQDTGEELFSKNADIELPIASVTKLMTALVIVQSGLKMNERIRITRADYVRSTARSKIVNGMVMTRQAVLQAALMSSDNRAASALSRTYPGGRKAFVAKMNETAQALGMDDSFFADATGLDNRNHSTARDLSKLVAAVHQHEVIRDASTAVAARLKAGRRVVRLQTTNRLIGQPDWDIGVQKTGYTTAAGRCMVVQSEFADRRVVMVVLDSPNSAQRALDMKTMRRYVETEEGFTDVFSAATPYQIF